MPGLNQSPRFIIDTGIMSKWVGKEHQDFHLFLKLYSPCIKREITG